MIRCRLETVLDVFQCRNRWGKWKYNYYLPKMDRFVVTFVPFSCESWRWVMDNSRWQLLFTSLHTVVSLRVGMYYYFGHLVKCCIINFTVISIESFYNILSTAPMSNLGDGIKITQTLNTNLLLEYTCNYNFIWAII